MILVVRHAVAGDKAKWKGRPDHERPLSGRGRKQAKALVKQHRERPVDRILSSPYARCLETVAPIADALGIEVEEHEALRPDADWKALRDLVLSLADEDVLLCSHGEVIGVLVERFPELGIKPAKKLVWKKGSTWVLTTKKGRLHKAVHKDPPR